MRGLLRGDGPAPARVLCSMACIVGGVLGSALRQSASVPISHWDHRSPFHTDRTCHAPLPARPLNRVLVAQRITQPQMVTGLVVAAQHVAACYLFIHRWGFGYLGAAFAACWSTFLSLALLAAWVALAGKGEQASLCRGGGWVGGRAELVRARLGCVADLEALPQLPTHHSLLSGVHAGVGPAQSCGAAGLAHICWPGIRLRRCVGRASGWCSVCFVLASLSLALS